MHMLYNSDHYVVVEFEVPTQAPHDPGAAPMRPESAGLRRGGYEIVDKFSRKEIFIEGAMAEHFKEGVHALIETRGSEEDMDEYIGRYASLMQQPVLLH